MFKFIKALFKKIKSNKRRIKARHYIPSHRGIWNYFRIFLLFCTLCVTLNVSAATINWEIINLRNNQDRIAYGLVGDVAFRTTAITSIENNTFLTFVANNAASVKGNYIVPSTTGYVKSIDFTISPSIKELSIFVIVFNSTSSSTYTYADVSDILTKTGLKNQTYTYTFDMNTTGVQRYYPVPEPNVVFLLLMGSCIFLISRP